MRPKTTRWLPALLFILLPLLSYAQPSNDLCTSAIPLACGATLSNQTTVGATGATANSCLASIGDDVWYTVVGTGQFFEITATGTGTPAFEPQIDVYVSADGTCNTITCQIGSGTGTTTVTAGFTSTSGTTYYISIGAWINGDPPGTFDLSLVCTTATPPPNDFCTMATPVTLGAGPLACGPLVTTSNVFATGTPGNYCATGTPSNTYGDGDIWFSFVAGTASAFLDLNQTVGSLYISVYDGCNGNCVYNHNFITTTVDENITGLTPGNTYYIQMYEASNDAFGTIEFCMYNSPPPPANDECANATPVTLGTGGACGPTITTTNAGATGVGGNVCNSTSTLYGGGDIWFSFTPATAGVFLDLNQTVGSLYISVYDGCAGSCVYNNNLIATTTDEYITGLTPGNTYYIRMYESGNDAFGLIEFCMYNAPPPPANDLCVNATTVTVGPSGGCGPTITTNNAGATGIPGNVCNTTSTIYGDGDVWFTFIAPTSTVFLDLASTVGTMYISVYDGCNGNCVYNNNQIVTTTDEAITGLTPGFNYYIRMYESGNDAFGTTVFCLYGDVPAPPNDLCSNATPISVGAPGVCGPTVIANNSGAGGTAGDVCGSTSTTYGGGDIWFSFVAGTSTVFLDLNVIPTSGSMYISVYDDCAGNCVYNNNFLSLTIDEAISGLTPGSTYLLRMYDSGNNNFGNIEFCMYNNVSPPANDDCANATPVTLGTSGCGPTVTATNTGATGTAGNYCATGTPSNTYGAGDIWFSFVPTETTVLLNLSQGVGSLWISVYDACGGTCVYSNNNISTTSAEVIAGLTPGDTYYIQMYESGNDAFGTIEFCMLNNPPPPANDECANATQVIMGNNGFCGPDVTGSNINATGVAGDVCGSTSATYGDGDVWFVFSPSTSNAYLRLSNTVGTLYISVYDNCNGNCVYNNNLISTSTDELITGLTPGSTYYIRVYESGNNAFGTFTFCMFNEPPPPANDDCANATPVTVGVGTCGPAVTGTNVSATGIAGNVCGSTSNSYGAGDVWFSFVASAPTVTLDLNSTVGSLYISVYDGCGGACVYNNNLISVTTDEIITGLTAGQTYYIRVYESLNDAFGTFDFCLSSPAPNVSTAAGCTSAAPQLVDGSSSPPKVDFYDSNGDIIASIENTQALGLTSVSLYVSNGLRQNGSTYYLGRNVSIVPSAQPARQVSVTIYATSAEINDIIAVEPTVNTINDLAFVKLSTGVCSATYPGGGAFLPFTATNFGSGFALTAGVTSFSEFFVMPSSAPLPVSLTRFTARAEGTRNVIEWAAATEQDLATYTVERADGTSFDRFAPVANVAPRGTSNGVEAIYSAYDDAPARVSYYRLKSVDLDGSVDYSEVVAVTRTSGAPGVKVYPNPSRAGGSASVALLGVDEAAGMDITVTDAAGRHVARVRYTTDGNYELPLSGLPSGMYTVSAVSGKYAFTQRLVIQ